MMVGRDITDQTEREDTQAGEELLCVKNLKVRNDEGLIAVDEANVTVHAGEIIGVAGVDGNGQLELGEAISGLRSIEEGAVLFGSEKITKVTPKMMLELGLGHIPDDRHKKGLVLPFSIKENMILGSHRTARYSKNCFINYKEAAVRSEQLREEYDIRCQSIEQPVADLSGGNQQKVILARVFDRDPKVILAIQPTRGLDIGASEFVRNRLVEARNKGKAILLVSTDLDEIMSVSDKIVVMFNGTVSEPIPAREATKERLGLLMAGGKERK